MTIRWMLSGGLGVLLALALPLRANSALEPVPRSSAWVRRHEQFRQVAAHEPVDVLFLGDSITDFWRNDLLTGYARGKSVWEARFVPLHAANFGLSGDRIQHVLWRVEHGELDGLHPKVVVVLIGTNNMGADAPGRPLRNTVPEIVAGVQHLVARIRTKLPASHILLLAIFPRGDKGPAVAAQIRAVNTAIARYDGGRLVHYLDFGDIFLDRTGAVSPTLMPDLLHPNTLGYQAWAAALQLPMQALLKSGQ